MKTRPGERLTNLDLAERGEKRLQAANEVADEVGESVDGDWDTYERFLALFIEALHPAGDGVRVFKLEAAGRLGFRPAAGGLELEDRHAVGRPVVRPLSCRDCGHACVLDADLFSESRVLGLEALDLGQGPGTRRELVGPALQVKYEGRRRE